MNITKEALKLGQTKKHALIGLLWDSLDAEHKSGLSEAKKKELDRRLNKIESGKGEFRSAEEVQKKAKKLIDEIRGKL